LTFGGRVEPQDENAQVWRISLAGAPGVLGGVRPGEADVQIETSRLVFRLDPDAQTFEVERFDLSGPQLAMTMSGGGQWKPGDRRVRTSVDISNTQTQAILRLWPSALAAKSRAWFLAHKNKGTVETGRIDVDLDEA